MVTISPVRVPAAVTFIRFTLRMLEPGGVSIPMPARAGEIDAVPDVDCYGIAHIPGTSLAGALRAHTLQQYGQVVADSWFGHLRKPGAGERTGTVDAVASAVWVLGSQLVSDTGEPVRDDASWRLDRWSTAIDRSRAAARVNSLRGATVLAADARIEVFLRWDGAPALERDRLLALIADWRPVIGRGTSRGMGRCQVESLRYGTLDLAAPADVLTWLTCGGPDLVRAVATQPRTPHPAEDSTPPPDHSAAVIEVPASVVGPLHIGGGPAPARLGADGHQVQVLLRERGHHLVPGSGIKGVLRSQVEYILRSVGLETHTCVSSSDTEAPCGECWTCCVFGHGGRKNLRGESVGRRAGIRFCDARITDAATRTRRHVAIDRFTGGAMDRLLYTVEVLEAGRFTLRIEIGAAHENDHLLRAVLRLALADLHDGRIAMGASTTRGYGSVRLDVGPAEAEGVLPSIAAAQAQLRHLRSTLPMDPARPQTAAERPEAVG